MVDGETGLLVEPGDAPGLALAVRRLLDDPIALASFGESARRRARAEFSVDAQLIDSYSRLVSSGQLSLETLWLSLQEGGALPESFDIQVERQRVG